MDDNILHHVMYRLGNAQVNSYPYPHFYVKDIFPEEYYQELIANLPDTSCYKGLSETGKVDKRAYKERFVLPLEQETLSRLPFGQLIFWSKFRAAIDSSLWQSMLLDRFGNYIRERFSSHYDQLKFSSVAELVRDQTNYSIGPHTDHPMRVITLLFYFPTSKDQAHLGTSIYRHSNPSFECEGFVHHHFDNFVRLHTVPFYPNSVFGFIKSKRSFHGVEPISDEEVERNLMNYYLQWD